MVFPFNSSSSLFSTRLSQTTSRHPYYSTSLQYKSPITLNQLLLSFASFLAYIPHSYLPFSQRSYPLFSREHASPPPVFAILCACVCNTHHLRVHTTSEYTPPPSTHHLRVHTTSEYTPPPSTHHLRVHTTSEYTPPPSTHHLCVLPLFLLLLPVCERSWFIPAASASILGKVAGFSCEHGVGDSIVWLFRPQIYL